MCIKIWPENHSEVPELEMSHIVRYEEEKTNPLGQNADLNWMLLTTIGVTSGSEKHDAGKNRNVPQLPSVTDLHSGA